MTGVSAYTLTTKTDTKEDTVHWVPMDNTTDATLNRRDRHGLHYKKNDDVRENNNFVSL